MSSRDRERQCDKWGNSPPPPFKWDEWGNFKANGGLININIDASDQGYKIQNFWHVADRGAPVVPLHPRGSGGKPPQENLKM